jgi:ureidoacrylate peracid hydrolase
MPQATPSRSSADDPDPLATPPSRTALLVVDLQNDYCSPGGAFERAGRDISAIQAVPGRVADLLAVARSAGVTTVYVQNTVDPAGRMRGALQRRRRARLTGKPAYVVDGTWGHAFASPLGPTADDLLVRKYASSAFVGTPLDQALRAARIELVAVTGVVTWGCVLATAHSAATLGYVPLIVTDCVAGDDNRLHEAALDMMGRSFGPEMLVSSAELAARWSSASEAREDRG